MKNKIANNKVVYVKSVEHNVKDNTLRLMIIISLILASIMISIINASAFETFEVSLTVHGLEEKIVTETYEGYDFNYTDFGNYSVQLDEIRVVESEQLTDDSELDKTAERVFRAELVSSSNEVFSRVYFAPSFIILSDPPTDVNVSEILLYVPYSKNTEYLRIYKGYELKLEVNIADLVCNHNNICDNFETYLSCSDCKWYDTDTICNSGYDDSYCDWDCYADADETDLEAECFKLNCNEGGLSGAICQKYKCDNGIKDEFEEGIDCGGICEDECPFDFCGDGICAEYEDNENCLQDCPNKLTLGSYIENLDSEPLQGYLIMTVEKQVNGNWQKHKEIINDLTERNLRIINPYEKLNIRDIFNSKNYVAEQGIFRLKVEFVDEAGKIIETKSSSLIEYVYFNVSLPIETNSNLLKQEWLSETSYKIEVEGQDGTSGYVEIETAKEPKAILFDGKILVRSKDWFYENGKVRINYQHSKHEIIIEFEKYNYIFIAVIIVCSIIIVIVAIKIALILRRR